MDRAGLTAGSATRRWGLIAPTAALGVAVLLPLCVLLATAFLAGMKFQPIESASMAPAHPKGALAIVEPLDPSLVQPGMVLVFEDPMSRGRLVAHRAVKQMPGDAPKWSTKGDANAETDPVPVSAAAIRGRVRWTIPGAGTIVSALDGWSAVAILVGAPLALLALTELRAARRRRRVAAASPHRHLSACPRCTDAQAQGQHAGERPVGAPAAVAES